MLVSVVIPCHDGVEDTRSCLRALATQGLPLDVVVVDNASRDATAALAHEFRGVRVVRSERNLGFAGGVNLGLEAARGDPVLILNNDAFAAPTMLERLLAALYADARIAIAAPVSNHVKGPARIHVGAAGATPEGRERVARELDASCRGLVQDVEAVAGLCMLIPRTVLQQLGGFDPRFRTGNFEDDDLCLRARLAGHRIVIVRDAFLHHEGHRTFQRLAEDYASTYASHEREFVAKWGADPAGRATIARMRGEPVPPAVVRRSVLEYPRWPDARLLLAEDASARRFTDAALAHVESFLSDCPRHPGGHALRVLELLRARRTRDALDAVGHILTRCYFDVDATTNLLLRVSRHVLELQRPRDAVGLLEIAIELDQQSGELHNLLGVSLMEAGCLDRAEREFERAREADHPHATMNLAICRWRQGRAEQAVRDLARAVARRPDDELARANLEAVTAALAVARRPAPSS